MHSPACPVWTYQLPTPRAAAQIVGWIEEADPRYHHECLARALPPETATVGFGSPLVRPLVHPDPSV